MKSLHDLGAPPQPDEPVLVREAGVPYQPPPSADPIAEWLDLMDVVEMLCPAWPVRDRPMQGTHWLL